MTLRKNKPVFCGKCGNFLVLVKDEKVTVTCVGWCWWNSDAFRSRVSISGIRQPHIMNMDKDCSKYRNKWIPSFKAFEFKKWLIAQLGATRGNVQDMIRHGFSVKTKTTEEYEDDKEEDIFQEDTTDRGEITSDTDREEETPQS